MFWLRCCLALNYSNNLRRKQTLRRGGKKKILVQTRRQGLLCTVWSMFIYPGKIFQRVILFCSAVTWFSHVAVLLDNFLEAARHALLSLWLLNSFLQRGWLLLKSAANVEFSFFFSFIVSFSQDSSCSGSIVTSCVLSCRQKHYYIFENDLAATPEIPPM